MPADVSIEALAERVRNLRGWRRRAAAFAAGAVSVLAMAPFFAWPVLWITLPALVWLIDGAHRPAFAAMTLTRWYGRPEIAAAEIGWWFGFGYFVPGLFWVGEAFLVEAETFAVLLPFAVTLLPGRPCPLLWRGRGARGALLDRRRPPRPRAGPDAVGGGVAARPCLERLSLEHAGLRAHLSAPPDAERGRPRHLRAHASRRPRLRAAARAVEPSAGRYRRSAGHERPR